MDNLNIYLLGDRLSNIVIGVSYTDPRVTTPVIGQYLQCTTHTPSVGCAEWLTLTCYQPMPGRYVIVQRDATGFLTLCGVKVFASPGW